MTAQEQSVYDFIIDASTTYREKIKQLGSAITIADISRIKKGRGKWWPKRLDKRFALGLVPPRRKRKSPPAMTDAVKQEFTVDLLIIRSEKRVLNIYDIVRLIETGGWRLTRMGR